MEIYQITPDSLREIPESTVDYEEQLERQLVRTNGAKIAGETFLYIGRQFDPSGDQTSFDLIATDSEGGIVILELKRGRSPRDMVTQALDYASGLQYKEYDELQSWYREFKQRHDIETPETDDLRHAHAEFFGLDEPLDEDEFNRDQRILLLANEYRDKTLAIADFLRERDIDVICVVHQSFQSEDGPHLLTTEAIRRPLQQEPSGQETDPNVEEPTTESGRRRLEFWKKVNEEIRNRSTSELNSGWTPANYTWQNIAFPKTQVPLQVACKTRDEEVEVKLVIRDDRELFETLHQRREEIEEALLERSSSFGDEEFDWESPDESDASKERGKIILRRRIDLADDDSVEENVSWLVDTSEAFWSVFTREFDLKTIE